MATLAELKEQRASHLTIAASIVAAADADKRAITDDEQAKVEAAHAEIDALNATIDREEKREAVTAKTRELSTQSRGAKAGAGASIPRAESIKDGFEIDPRGGYASDHEFFRDVMAADTPGSSPSKRLNRFRAPIVAAVGSDEQSTFSNPYGGYLLPSATFGGFLQTAAEADPIAGRVTAVPMATPSVRFAARVDKTHTNSVSGGFRVYRRAEADTAASSRQEYEQIELTAYGLFGIAYATEEVLSDSLVSVIAMIQAGFGDEFTSKLIVERMQGTGVGEYLGILNSGATLSIGEETGQAAATIVYENILKMRARCWGYANAIWMGNHDIVSQLMLMNQSVGTGGQAVWQPSAREDHPDTLLGRPLILTEYCKTLGTTGDLWCVNWSQYLEGTYQPLQNAESIHVRFVNHERCFKFWMRNAGQPWWRAALTPKNGATMSPFVKLDTRA